MPAPKKKGTTPILKGIKHNTKFHFWVVFQCFNDTRTPDDREFFLTEKEAIECFNSLQ